MQPVPPPLCHTPKGFADLDHMQEVIWSLGTELRGGTRKSLAVAVEAKDDLETWAEGRGSAMLCNCSLLPLQDSLLASLSHHCTWCGTWEGEQISPGGRDRSRTWHSALGSLAPLDPPNLVLTKFGSLSLGFQ